jgi:N-acetylmuramoyl-L-alanine amidase
MTQWIGCPDSNYRPGRPFGLRPEAIVIHIMDGSFIAGESVFSDPSTQKSAHYGISRAGDIHQYVKESDTAFHAGIVINPTWTLIKPRINPNFYTIGVEHEGRPDDVWPEAQLSASAALVGEIASRWSIPLDELHVIRHREIRASKTCPGNWLKIVELLQRVPTQLALGAVAGADTATLTNAVVSSGNSSATLPVPTIGIPVSIENPKTTKIVRTLKNVNLRTRPDTNAQVVRVIPAQSEIVVSMFEVGQQVADNAYWYVDLQGNYLWAGATDKSDPTTAAA